jgi:predicted transcriptional regulator
MRVLMNDGSRREAGELESEVLAALWAAGRPLTPGETREELGGSLAYTTVMTTLSRLHDKGVVDRRRSGRSYAYSPNVREAEFAARRFRALLDRGHDRYRRLVGIAANLNPLSRPTVGAVDYLLERWADEDAAREVGSRHLTARALARAAVADGPRRHRLWQPSFAAQKVVSRVNALLAPAPAQGSRLAMLLPAAIGVIGAAAAVAAAHDLAHLFDLRRGDG